MNQLDQDEKLIIEVQQYPGLYDQNSYDYRDLRKKEKMWQNVSESLGLHAKECQARWRVLRDKFVREMRKNVNPKRAGSSALQVYQGSWPLMSQLMFLTSHVKHKPVRPNKREIYSDTGGTDEDEELEPSEEEEDIVADMKPDPTSYLLTDAAAPPPQPPASSHPHPHPQQQHQHPSHTHPPPPHPPPASSHPPPASEYSSTGPNAKRLKYDVAEVQKMNSSSSSSPSSSSAFSSSSSEMEILKMIVNFQSARQEDEENEERLFCLSLVPSLKRLPLEKRSLAKLQIQKILHIMEFPDLKCDF
ncbi:mediator of RNA polymerase II transcription subunit 15-like [Macrobrachium nipponense]|uniref:mediator of RNA polymerase II transcription subunit 15-like n=1 Tax=Macrobrachium nipponense TaxID=159736 RepID=UPI0030C7D669